MFLPLLVAFVPGCDPYRKWPDPETVFPYVYTPQTDLQPYEEVRFETQTWDPTTDLMTAGQYLLKAANHRRSAPDEELDHFETMKPTLPPLGDGTRLSFVGDVMWVGDNWSDVADAAAPLLDGQLRVGNLETPTSPDDPTELDQLPLYAFNSPTAILDDLPLDLLQLDNNHSLDVGDSGLEATVAQVEAHGYLATGVDQHATIDVGGKRIAFLSYTWGVNRPETPTTHDLFIVPFGHVGEDIDMSGLEADVKQARADADTVVVLLHWGFEYEWYPDPRFLVFGRQIVAAGADLVVGAHPHVVQPPEICTVNHPDVVPGIGTCSLRTDDGEPRTAAILYSLGNFATAMPTAPCQVGIVATVSVDGHDVTGMGWSAVGNQIEGPGHVVRPIEDLRSDPDLAQEETRLEAHIGAGWRR